MRTRVVTGIVYDNENQPCVGSDIQFNLNRSTFVDGVVVIPTEIVATTDGTGAFSVTLWCNVDGLTPTFYTCTLPNGETFRFQLPYALTPIDLDDLFIAESLAGINLPSVQTLIDTHTDAADPHAQYLRQVEADALYVPLARTLTINGTPLDLSANRSWTVGNVLTGGSYANPNWITSLAWSKITGTPTTLAGYGITDGYTQVQGDARYAQLAAANIFTIGPNLFRAGANGNVALAARRHSGGATGNIQEWQDDAGIALGYVNASGDILSTKRVAIGSTPSLTPPLTSPGTTLIYDPVGLSVYSGTDITSISSNPSTSQFVNIYSNPVFNPSTPITHGIQGIHSNVTLKGTTGFGFIYGMLSYVTHATSGTTTQIQAQTNGIYNSGGGAITDSTVFYPFYSGTNNSTAPSSVTVIQAETILTSGSSIGSSWGLYLRPFFPTGSTVTTHEAIRLRMNQVSAGATITNMYGIHIDKMIGGSTLQRSIQTDGGTVHFKTGTANITGLIVQGFTSQSANLQEWWDSSAVMSYITPSGGAFIKGHSAIGSGSVIDGNTLLPIGLNYLTLLSLAEEITTPGTFQRQAITAYLKVNPSGASSGSTFGLDFEVETTAGNVQTHGTFLVGVYGSAKHRNAMAITNVQAFNGLASNLAGASVTNVQGMLIAAQNLGSGSTVTNLIGVDITNYNTSSGAVTNAYGIRIAAVNVSGGGTITNNYGINIGNITGGSTLNYAIFTAGGQVRFETGAAAVIGQVIKGFTSQSASLQEWWNSSSVVVASVSANGVGLHRPTDAGTNAVLTALTLGHNSSGSIAANFGTGLIFQGQSTTTADRDMASINALWTTATDASRASAIILSAVAAAGSLTEYLRVSSAGLGTIAGNASCFISPTWSQMISNGGAVFLGNGGTSSSSGLKLYGSATIAASQYIAMLFGGTGGVETARFDVASAAASSAAVVDNLILRRNPTSGTPAIGTGHQIHFVGKTDTTADRDQATIATSWTNVTDGAQSSVLIFSTVAGGGALTEHLRLGSGVVTAAAAIVPGSNNTRDLGSSGARWKDSWFAGGMTARTGIFAATVAGDIPLISRGFASQTGNLQEWQDSGSNVLSSISENGYFTTRKTSAPVDAELSTGEVALWFDSTAGAAKLMIKAKNASGTVVTGSVPLT